MKTSWLSGKKTEEEKEEIRNIFKASGRFRAELAVQLEKKIESNSTKRVKSEYDVTNWAYQQADMNGYERALTEVLSLIK